MCNRMRKFHAPAYDPDVHWHIGVDVEHRSFEAIGFKRLDDSSWDVFFNDFDDPREAGLLAENVVYVDDVFGFFLFNAKEDEVEECFRKWVSEIFLPVKKSVGP